MAIDEKSMVPTVFIGVGGTGAEILSRLRRLIEESYGDLKNLPIVSFLWIDTDKEYKITNPEAAGPVLKDNERHWARVSGSQVRETLENMDKYPWIQSWFPNELEKNMGAMEAGAAQIRPCGRFAFFCNYHQIQTRFKECVSRIKGKENFMLDRHGVRVANSKINVFITGSISGGTGSGMMLDLGYSVRKWLEGEGGSEITAVVPMPNAFAGISVGDRVLANGYAALMELSYYSDSRTEYVSQFSSSLSDEVRSKLPPFDFTYLVGNRNGESEFKLDTLREMISQNMFLDMTSDFAPHKRSIRDNMKGKWASPDPEGRGYPKQFMSFGLSAVEIPITQIRASMANRLAKDLVHWWLNEGAEVPPQMMEVVKRDLKQARLTDAEVIADILAASDRSYLEEVTNWINGLRDQVANEKLLGCTQQGINAFSSEKGKILQFLSFLKPEVDNYRAEHLRELSPDERQHGDFLKKMYANRDDLIRRGRQALEAELYTVLGDRSKGPKFADNWVTTTRQIFDDATEKFRREQDKTWAPNETNRQSQYEAALQDIAHFQDKFGVRKEAQMEEYWDAATEGLQGQTIAFLQRKSRAMGLEVLLRLQEHLTLLETRFSRYRQRLIQARDFFNQTAQKEADSADALTINGYKIFDRQELNALYQDFLEQLAGTESGSKRLDEIGLDRICSQMSEQVLKSASPMWKENRRADEVMQLFDLTEIPAVQEDDLRDLILNLTKHEISTAPAGSRLRRDLSACDRMLRANPDPSELNSNLRIAYDKSKPLILMNDGMIAANRSQLTPAINRNVAILGGRNTSDISSQKMLTALQEFVGDEESIKPLGDNERHRIIFIQEMGGFSLRCIQGMSELRKSYQDWKGESITARRAQMRGENRELPIPVHMTKEPPFWDMFPEDEEILQLVVQARALGFLFQETNRTTKESCVRYVRKTEIGSENVDLASTWDEVVQVLEVLACRDDKQLLQRQVQQELNNAELPEQKAVIFQKLMDYLQHREEELDRQKLGGKDSSIYRREASIILKVTKQYGLNLVPDEPMAVEKSTIVETATTSAPSMGSSMGFQIAEPELELTPAAASTQNPVSNREQFLEKATKLKEMKDLGLLTDEEFQLEKNRLINL